MSTFRSSTINIVSNNIVIDGKIVTSPSDLSSSQNIPTFGAVNIISGVNNFDILNEKAEGKGANSSTNTLILTSKANIKSGEIKVTSLSEGIFRLSGKLSSKGKKALVSRVGGSLFIPTKSIYINSLGGIHVEGDFESDNIIAIKSSDFIRLGSREALISNDYPFLSAPIIRLISGNETIIWGRLDSHKLESYSSSFRNEGLLIADELIDIQADENIINRFGGLISSDTILMKSKDLIQNGAEKPYRLLVSNTCSASEIKAINPLQ